MWLHSDLPKALKAEHLSDAGSQQRGPNFCVGKVTETVVVKAGCSRLRGPMSVCWSLPFHTHADWHLGLEWIALRSEDNFPLL